MSTWQITERATGTVVYAYTSDEAVDWPDYPFATHNHNLVVPEVQSDPARRVTKLQFRNLFTGKEKVAIEFASIDNPNGTQEERFIAGVGTSLDELDHRHPEVVAERPRDDAQLSLL